jgi:hypothetical protein
MTMPTQTALLTSQRQVTSKDRTGLKAVNLFRVAYDTVGLDMDHARWLSENPEFPAALRRLIKKYSTTNRYVDEEIPSSYRYPLEYRGPKPVREQIDTLAWIFGLNPADAVRYAETVLPTLTLPEGAEGWFAIPSVDALANCFFPEVTDPAERYCLAVTLVHQKIATSRSFHNYREGQITKNHLRQSARTLAALDVIAKTQKGDILIVAAQLGMRHRGKSTRRARETFTSKEFGLGALAVGSILLTHPERLVRFAELDMDCPGDEFALTAEDFCSAVSSFFGGKVRFCANSANKPNDDFGSVSGFLPSDLVP